VLLADGGALRAAIDRLEYASVGNRCPTVFGRALELSGADANRAAFFNPLNLSQGGAVLFQILSGGTCNGWEAGDNLTLWASLDGMITSEVIGAWNSSVTPGAWFTWYGAALAW
jgi:hypothetical protein